MAHRSDITFEDHLRIIEHNREHDSATIRDHSEHARLSCPDPPPPPQRILPRPAVETTIGTYELQASRRKLSKAYDAYLIMLLNTYLPAIIPLIITSFIMATEIPPFVKTLMTVIIIQVWVMIMIGYMLNCLAAATGADKDHVKKPIKLTPIVKQPKPKQKRTPTNSPHINMPSMDIDIEDTYQACQDIHDEFA